MGSCLFCDNRLSPKDRFCIECGLECPERAVESAPAPRARRGFRRLLATTLALPLILGLALAAHIGGLPLIRMGDASPVAGGLVTRPITPPVAYNDPLMRSVWVEGMKSVQTALDQPGDAAVRGGFVNVAASHVVTLCGEVAGTSGYANSSGRQRFISVFGQPAATTLEGTDPSFDVLWNRVCRRDQAAL